MTLSVPTRDSIGAAFVFVRENLRFVTTVSAAGAALMTVIGGLSLAIPALGMVSGVGATVVQAFLYGAFIGAALFGAGAVRARWMNDGLRVWTAIAIIGFFLFIVMFVAGMIASIVLVAGPLGPYLPDLERAGADQAAVLTVMTRFADENPLPLLLLALVFGAIWIFLTSRLYLAAPASVEQQRIRTFETWSWTKGVTLQIIGARLMLLLPANIFVGAVGLLIGRLVSVDTMSAGAGSANPAGYLVYVFVSSFLSIGFYSALEAGLSSHLYRRLKPAEAPAPGH